MAKSLLKSVVYHARRGTLISRAKWEVSPRVLAPAPVRLDNTHSSARLNTLYAQMPACSAYLEVGVEFGKTFENISVPFRWGVDPHPLFTGRRLPAGVHFSSQRSDQFFERLPRQQLFDLVFLDGLHEWRQTYRDLIGSLNHTPPHGIIVVDDVVPDDRLAAIPHHATSLAKKREAGIHDLRWQGDVFKMVLVLHQHHPELDFRVITGRDPQAVVWRRPGIPLKYAHPPQAELDAEFGQLSYDDVFVDDQIPAVFRPTDETSALDAAIAGSWAVSDGPGHA